MNKRKLQEFASWAKQNLEKQIELSLKKIGINSETDIKRSQIQGDVTIVDGVETTFKKQFQHQREEIINRIKADGYNHTIEQFASTWFNRIVALRFLEVHDYLDHGFKLFPKEPNTLPEVLSKLALVKDDLNLDMKYIEELTSSGNNNEELYRYVLFQQCNALGKALPMLFSSGMSYLEHFIPTPLLFGDTIINKLIEIDEDDFKEDVEIIGWLYQFYISSKKYEVFASKATITKDTLPAVTQLFTPDWIVKYMAENSIGRIWLECYPSSELKSKMKYYVDEAKQEPDVEEKLKSIRYHNVNPEEIKIIEPCSGSGHILVYCFDLLLQMYQEKGYNKKDIPSLILRNNLVGFDIDQRATQLASFALVMRARSIDNKFFDEGRYVRPKVYEIIDSKALAHCEYNGKSYKEIIKEYNSKQWIGENQLTTDELKSIDYLVDLFDDGKVIGSLLKVNTGKYLTIQKKLANNFKENTQADIFTSAFFEHEFKDLLEILRIAYFMAQKYDVMITNPPYIGISGLESVPKSYLIKNYPDSKTDMFASFMDTKYVHQHGFLAMINMQAWMYQPTYKNLRRNILTNNTITSFIHLGSRAFEEISGEVVQTCTFVIMNVPISGFNSQFFKLNEVINKQEQFLKASKNKSNANIFIKNSLNLKRIPEYVIGYWITKKMIDLFDKEKFKDFVQQRVRLSTGDNEKFVRLWHEIYYHKLNKKWFIFNKGGQFRRWYGNLDLVIDYENNGEILKKSPKYQKSNESYYFKSGITYSDVSTGNISFRILPEKTLSDAAGPMLEVYDLKMTNYELGFGNSVVFQKYASFLCPGMHYNWGSLSMIPNIVNILAKDRIDKIVNANISIVKIDWDSFETSWDFKKHPLIGIGKLSKLFNEYYTVTKSNFEILKANEEELNEYFIKLYGLQDELTKNVDDAYVSILIADKERDIKSLISYLVGVLMGRYSLSEEGLIFAGGTFEPSRYGNHDVDSDGIIPIYSDISIKDGLVHRLIGMIKDIYGSEKYRDNISFIAEALGKKSNETSEETLNRYLNEGFYQDHLKTYQKHPIYWMFSSGKFSGFKCLIYMHRYNQDTLAKINAGYFQPATTIIRNQISEIERQISIAGEIEKRLLEKKRLSLVEQLSEAHEYGQILDYMANKYISIDLDDGVKVNYTKFQGIEVTTNGGKVKKDLLIPIK
ncbi:MAG: BREX-1 system adenine-specific DNA-methyltransferase PglX [Bacilli bacterium]|nr:BREX-1 system adenine-specific DNA-methyltransferase PglX [Bacilli bacterium]